ncbi:hypothetical protein [Teredinibacter turnerae]|uniref:hypothetical protein n=1 Tax=Teredinibacter turnerae TaxID=2426 RepID=UPI0009E44E03|nr:hypothetical protein [Teredinibacter turnerae]
MRYFFTVLFVVFLSSEALSGEDIGDRTISFVYQPDLSPTQFEFEADKVHGCGSSLYRVNSDSEAVANRKFSLVLAAFTAGKKISFHDTGSCVGSRSIVSWVRLVN